MGEEIANTTCPPLECDSPVKFITTLNVFNVVCTGDNNVGSVLTARCVEDGYILPGNNNVFFCTYNGTWYPEFPGNCTVPESLPPLDDVSDKLSGDRLLLVASWAGVGGTLLLFLLVLGLAMCIRKARKNKTTKETVKIGMSSRSPSLDNGFGPSTVLHAYANEVDLSHMTTELSTPPRTRGDQVALPSLPNAQRAASENNYNYNYIQDREESRRRVERSNSFEMPMTRQIPRPVTVYCPEDHPDRYQHARPNVYAKAPFAEYDGNGRF